MNINAVALSSLYWFWEAILRQTCAILHSFVEQQRKFDSHTTKWGHNTHENTEYCLAKVEHWVGKSENVGDTTNKNFDTLVFVEQQRKFGSHTTKWGHNTLENTEYCLAKVEHWVGKSENVGDTSNKNFDTLVFLRIWV